jgi:glycosyltransferase involved in cell wall biosynthesis
MIVTDAWYPQVNGVVRTLDTVRSKIEESGHKVMVVRPNNMSSFTLPCPTYPDISLAFGSGRNVAAAIDEFEPEFIHIATEGPLGWTARRICRNRGLNFTTSFHTRFPEYVYARARVPLRLTYSLLRKFHGRARRVMVNTPSMERALEQRGFTNLSRWTRGVDTEMFKPREEFFLDDLRPIQLYVGRVAIEKNIVDFLNLKTPGTKYVVGDGPMLRTLKMRYPDVRFVGFRYGAELASYYAAADVLVFPSRTDTYGLVMLEALASGLPVAAYPVTGPLDVITDPRVGCLDNNLHRAVETALSLSRRTCREFATQFSWLASAQQFMNNLFPVRA